MPFYSGVLRVGREAVRKPDKQQSNGGSVLGERGQPQPRFVSRQERVGAPDRKYWHGECITCCSKHSSTIWHQANRACALETLPRGCRLVEISNFINVLDLVQYMYLFVFVIRNTICVRSRIETGKGACNDRSWRHHSTRTTQRNPLEVRRGFASREGIGVDWCTAADWNIFNQVQ